MLLVGIANVRTKLFVIARRTLAIDDLIFVQLVECAAIRLLIFFESQTKPDELIH